MSQFQRLYTDRQKHAVGVAQVDGVDGKPLTAMQAIAALMAGQLADDAGAVPPPAHTMPKSTAHDCARKIRLSRDGKRGPLDSAAADAVRDELGRRLVTAADRLTTRAERRSRSSKDDAKTADLVTKAARASTAVVAYLRAAAEKPPPGAPAGETSTAGQSPPPASELDRIGAAIDAEERRLRREASTG